MGLWSIYQRSPVDLSTHISASITQASERASGYKIELAKVFAKFPLFIVSWLRHHLLRYISEDHGGTVLHPIDILDAGTGALVDTLIDPNLQLINPVNVPHPSLDVILTGSSGHLYCWRPEVRFPPGTRFAVAGHYLQMSMTLMLHPCDLWQQHWHKRPTINFKQ